MLHTIYQDFRTCGFRQEYGLYSPYVRICKILDPMGWPFLPKEYYLNKIVKDLLDTIKASGFVVSDKTIFYVLLTISQR